MAFSKCNIKLSTLE